MSNQTQHTPGPWSRNIPPAIKYPVVFAGRNLHVAQVRTGGMTPEEVEANIRLIAAAPELLEACKGILSTYVFLESMTAGHEPQHANTVQALAAIRAAIDKAEGEMTP